MAGGDSRGWTEAVSVGGTSLVNSLYTAHGQRLSEQI